MTSLVKRSKHSVLWRGALMSRHRGPTIFSFVACAPDGLSAHPSSGCRLPGCHPSFSRFTFFFVRLEHSGELQYKPTKQPFGFPLTLHLYNHSLRIMSKIAQAESALNAKLEALEGTFFPSFPHGFFPLASTLTTHSVSPNTQTLPGTVPTVTATKTKKLFKKSFKNPPKKLPARPPSCTLATCHPRWKSPNSSDSSNSSELFSTCASRDLPKRAKAEATPFAK